MGMCVIFLTTAEAVHVGNQDRDTAFNLHQVKCPPVPAESLGSVAPSRVKLQPGHVQGHREGPRPLDVTCCPTDP